MKNVEICHLDKTPSIEYLECDGYPQNNIGHAKFIADYARNYIIKNEDVNAWFVFNNKKGIFVSTQKTIDYLSAIVQRIVDHLEERIKLIDNDNRHVLYDNLPQRVKALSGAKDGIYKELGGIMVNKGLMMTFDEMNNDKDSIVVANGVLNMETRELIAYSPDSFPTRKTNVKYDASAECPNFISMIKGFCKHDQELVNWIQMWFGYSLSGYTNEQMYLVCQGPGSNGKSTLSKILNKVFGTYFVAIMHYALANGKNGDGATPELAKLANGVRMAICQELPQSYQPQESLLKMITGEDIISARSLYENPFDFTVSAKITSFTNFLPRLSSNDPAVWRRTFLFPAEAVFEGSAIDKYMDSKLDKEKSGILNWLIDGFNKWKNGPGLKENMPTRMMELKKEWMTSLNPFEDWIEANYKVLEPNEKPNPITVSELMRRYESYAISENIISEKGKMLKKTFIEKLKSLKNGKIRITKPKNVDTILNLQAYTEIEIEFIEAKKSYDISESNLDNVDKFKAGNRKYFEKTGSKIVDTPTGPELVLNKSIGRGVYSKSEPYTDDCEF